MHSARERRPGSARSNYTQFNNVDSTKRPTSAVPLTTATTTSSRAMSPLMRNITSEKFRNITDPLYVNRHQSRDIFDTLQSTHKMVTTVLAPSRHPTVLPNEQENLNRYKRPPICPQKWIDDNDQPEFKCDGSHEEKKKITRQFIEKNVQYMGEYKYEFRNKSPQEIYDVIMSSPSFNSTMLDLKMKERVIRSGTSSKHLKSLFSDNSKVSLHQPKFDPFIQSLQTPRDLRKQKMESLFAPAMENRTSDFGRGKSHVVEYGNFSNFNGYLNKNSSTMLNR
jgi:hypothetical protein